MVSHIKTKPELLYAYSLLGTKNMNKGEKEINFAKLNKGFYDKLISIDKEIKTSKTSLHTIKSNGIKELIYANKPVPGSWKNKISYYKDIYTTMNQDQRFLLYLGKGCPETSRNKDEQRDLFGGLNKEKRRGYSSTNMLQNNMKLTQSFCEKTFSDTYKKLVKKKTVKIGFMEENSKKINDILDEYNTAYPFEYKSADDLPKIKQQISNRKTSSEKFNKKLNMSRSEVFKSTIYSNLIPDQGSITIKTGMQLKKKPKEEKKTLYGPFLNFDYYSLNRKIELSNMKVKQHLQDINNFGPYYSHCPSCLNRNLEFYETMEPNQCVKLLLQLKKMKNKK